MLSCCCRGFPPSHLVTVLDMLRMSGGYPLVLGIAVVLLVAVGSNLNGVDAFWRLPCAAPITIERSDPIVTINKLSGHAHTVMGASAFSAVSTPTSIRKSRYI
jgi:hypothetical protein